MDDLDFVEITEDSPVVSFQISFEEPIDTNAHLVPDPNGKPGEWVWSDEPKVIGDFTVQEISETRVKITKNKIIPISSNEILSEDNNRVNVNQLHITDVNDLCLLRECKHNAYGTHLKHPKTAPKVYFGSVFDAHFLPLETRYRTYTAQPNACFSCRKNIIPSDYDSRLCNECLKRDLAHKFEARYDEDIEEREYLESLGYLRTQEYSSRCPCAMCWQYRNDGGIDGTVDELFDEDGNQITVDSSYHTNPTRRLLGTGGNCATCGELSKHYYHRIFEEY